MGWRRGEVRRVWRWCWRYVGRERGVFGGSDDEGDGNGFGSGP